MEEDDSTLKKLSSLLFGGSCFLCRGASRDPLCSACDAALPRLAASGEPRLCPRCALTSPGGAVCGRCLAAPPRYDATVAALAYSFPADVLIQALKFRGELALAPVLAAMLSETLSAGEKIDLVLPVPLAPARLRERGYNQSAEIARRLPGRAPLELFLCQRSRDTTAQAGLPWAERRRNVRGAFRCARAIPGGTVAVVDDVMTTGATLDEMAATLKQAGAARVVNWVVARTYVDDAAPGPRPEG
jgi:ComF family protein